MDVFLLISSLVLASLVLVLTWSLYYAKRSPSVASAEKKQHEDDQLQGPEDARKFDEKDGKSGKTTKKRPVPASKENKLFTHPWLVTTLKGHTGQVLDMDFSPSGKYLVTCSEDEEVFCETTASEEKSESSRSSSKAAKLSRRQRRNRVKKVATLKEEPKPPTLPSIIDPLPSRQRLRRATPLKHYSRLRMSDMELYYHLSHYLLTEDDLVNLGFPVESALYPGLAIIYKNPDNHVTFSRSPVGGEARGGRHGANEEIKAPHSPSLEKRCMRCEKGFFVTADGEYLTEERCTYHWGKFNRVDCEYTCCSGVENSGGCCTAQLHVWNGISSGMNGPYPDYVRARACRNKQYSVYALDCEMCFTGLGLELSKVTVVSIDGRLVYEALVKPDRIIVDYNTRFSGLNGSYLHRPTKTLREVQNDLMGFIHSGTILVGHGIENDLRALRLLHNNIIDTAILFPHHFGLPYRRSLKSLVRAYLKRDIQTGAMGHDSYEDARACAELVLWKLHKDLRRRSECVD